MRRQKQTFNQMLLRYNKYLRKLRRLEVTGRNKHRQSVLHCHITRLREKLKGLYISIKGAAALAAVSGMCVMAAPDAEAQTVLRGYVLNPFGLPTATLGDESLRTSTPSFQDLDNDGDIDLMVGDDDGSFHYFQNTGTVNAPAFAAAQVNPFSLTNIGNQSSPTLADLDNDGDFDLMSGNNDGVFHYFQNTGTVNAPAFAAAQVNPFSLTDIGKYSRPTFIKLDNDGDFDLMTGEYSGEFFYFENTGTVNAPAFTAVQVNPFSLTDVGTLSHPTSADLDNDGDIDLMVGDFDGDFHYFQNTGTVNAPAFAAAQVNLSSLINLNLLVIPSFADLDNDGDLDLMSGTYGGNFWYFENNQTPTVVNLIPDQSVSEDDLFSFQFESNVFNDADTGDALTYSATLSDDSTLPAWLTFTPATRTFSGTPTGTDTGTIMVKVTASDGLESVTDIFDLTINEAPLLPVVPTFEAVQQNLFGLTDVGTVSAPSFVDLDNDGDFDIMATDNTSHLLYFQNTGSASAPAFAAVQQNPFSLSQSTTNAYPFMVDLDNDEDFDIITGDGGGDFGYYENTGTKTAPAFGTRQDNPFSLTGLSSYNATPTLADLDGDGDFDLLAGENSGNLKYFENTGTDIAPAFGAVQTNPFSLTDIGRRTAPSFVDLDNDGDIDLMVGEYDGEFFYFENTGTTSVPAFKAVVQSPFNLTGIGYFPAPAFADLDDDGDMDLMAGELYGNFHYFKHTPTIPTVTWDGETDSDWGTATNWDTDALPTSGDNVVIPDVATDPVITSDVTINDIDVQASAVLTVTTNSLTVNGDITLNGTTSVASGASLVPLGTITGSGSATINRNTTFGASAGRYSVIGSPVTTGSTSSLGGIIYSYDETVAYDPGGTDGSARFVAVSTPETMTVGDAYFSANTGNIAFTGTPNSGNINVSLVYDESNDGGATNAGFNLVSNPYPAAISFTDFVNGNSAIDGAIYVWDDGGSEIGARTNSDYIVATTMGISGGSGRVGSADGFIRSTQGFFVKATSAGTLNFTPSMMVGTNNSDAGYFRKESPTVLRFALSSEKAYNDILIGFAEDATTDFDRTMDAYKFKGNGVLQLSSKMKTSNMAIQALPVVSEQTTVKLNFDALNAGIYTFELKDASSYGFVVYLKDHKLDQLIDMSENNVYTFESSSVTNSDRFSLVFSPSQVLSIDDKIVESDMVIFSNANGLNVSMTDKLANATVKIYNLSGTLVKSVRQVDFTSGNWTTSFSAEGLFIITVQAEGKLLVKKFIK